MTNRSKRSKIGIPDRISNLPDEVLAAIISHLPVRELLATSLLSRRWRNLWTITPHLELDLSNETEPEIIVSSVFLRRHNSGQHSVCRLTHLNDDTTADIPTWIPYLSLNSITKLILHCSPSSHNFDAYQIYTIPSLEELYLECFAFNPLGPPVCAARLTSISLNNVIFGRSDNLNMYIAMAPQLQHLRLFNFYYGIFGPICIYGKALIRLEIDRLRFGSLDLDAPLLTTLGLHDLDGLDDIVAIAPSLLFLNTTVIVDQEVQPHRPYDLSASIHILNLFNKNNTSIFTGLRKLFISIKQSDQDHFLVLTSVLPKCPHLRELGITIHPELMSKRSRIRAGLGNWARLRGTLLLKNFSCLEHHMEHLWIKGYTIPVLEAIHLVLWKALALKKLVISHRDCTAAQVLKTLRFLLPCASKVDIILKPE